MQEDDCNVRACRYLIAQTVGTCPRCHRATRLVALGLPAGHEISEPDDDAPDGAGAGDTWVVADHMALLFHVVHLSEHVPPRVAERSGAYRRDAALAGAESCWANHCEHCGAPFDDQDLFCEPGGAFLPVSEIAARRIRWQLVDEAIAAAAGGYAPEPAFLAPMIGD